MSTKPANPDRSIGGRTCSDDVRDTPRGRVSPGEIDCLAADATKLMDDRGLSRADAALAVVSEAEYVPGDQRAMTARRVEREAEESGW
jgi:hypothetical protein